MTIYTRARRHMFKMLGVLALGVGFIVAVDLWIGHSSIAFAIVIFGLFVANIGMLRFNCPNCGSNLFFRGAFVVPWPNRRCSRCRLDLTRVEGL